MQCFYTFAVQLINPPGREVEGVGDFLEGHAFNVPFLQHVTFGIVQQYQRVLDFIKNFVGPHCQIEQLLLEESTFSTVFSMALVRVAFWADMGENACIREVERSFAASIRQQSMASFRLQVRYRRNH